MDRLWGWGCVGGGDDLRAGEPTVGEQPEPTERRVYHVGFERPHQTADPMDRPDPIGNRHTPTGSSWSLHRRPNCSTVANP